MAFIVVSLFYSDNCCAGMDKGFLSRLRLVRSITVPTHMDQGIIPRPKTIDEIFGFWDHERQEACENTCRTQHDAEVSSASW